MSPNPPTATPTSAPSASSASEVGFDPNEFPALGSLGQTSNSNPSSNNNPPSSLGSAALASSTNNPPASTATSYAIQAGQGGSTAVATNAQPRDFGPEDFPALGGQQVQQALPSQSQPQSQNQLQPSENHLPAHPPGLNGFNDHRTNILGSLNGTQQPNTNNLPSSLSGTQQSGTPGMLNLRGIHPGFQNQGDAEKQRVSVRSDSLISPQCTHLHHFACQLVAFVSVTNVFTKSPAKLCLETQSSVSRGMECSQHQSATFATKRLNTRSSNTVPVATTVSATRAGSAPGSTTVGAGTTVFSSTTGPHGQ